MTFRRFLAAAALAALPFSASAQAQVQAQAQGGATAPHATPFEPFVFQPAAEVAAMTHKPGGKTVSVITSDHETYYIEYVTRGINTAPEAHGHWYDYIHVLDGEGSITYGGTQEGATDAGQQEMRGGKLVGGKTIILHPGDRLVIPPGLPHLFTATPGNSFTYLIFKQRV
jgi:mannose-6-phosphate isomerase-like protein (cupin superfamily)